ncbi:MAG: abo, partial [Gammaproteobacteria bacterium]|nr:abo [Gammaproteobacteria bacterium]
MTLNDADIIVVGGGIMGCAIFHTLVCQTNYSVLLVEAQEIAGGCTGQSGGFLRIYHDDPRLTALAAQGFNYYQTYAEHTQASCQFQQTGYLLVSDKPINPVSFDIANSHVERQHATVELPAHTLSHGELALSPQATKLYQASAGCINTQAACQQWIQAALRVTPRANVLTHTQVLALLASDKQVKGIQTTQGSFSASRVIMAAGTGSLGCLADLTPIAAQLSQQAFQYNLYRSPQGLNIPAVIDLTRDLYLIPQAEGTIIAGFLNQDQTVNGPLLKLDSDLAKALHLRVQTWLPTLDASCLLAEKISADLFSRDG